MPANESRPPRISTLDSSNAQHRGPRIGSSVKAHVKEIKGGGQPLPASVRGSFEGRFGCDFSDVRIHTNADAEVGAIHARAFSRGTDIVFGSGQYAPQTKEGQRLLAHELTHVIQQRNATSGRDVIRRAPAPKKPAYQDCTESTTTLTNPKGELIRALDLTLIHEAAHSIGLGMTTKHPPYRGSAEYPLGAGPPGKDETAAIRMDNPDAYGYFAAHVWRDIDTECRALSEIIEVKGSTPAPAVPGKSKEAR